MFFKETLTEWFFVEPKMVLLWHRCEQPFEAKECTVIALFMFYF